MRENLPKLKISETDFSLQVEDLLKLFHWRYCHFRRAWSSKGYRTPIKGNKGFPDYCCVRPPRLIFAELKDKYSKPTPDQEAWLEDLKECVRFITSEPLMIRNGKAELKLSQGIELLNLPEVYLFRPNDIEKVAEILR